MAFLVLGYHAIDLPQYKKAPTLRYAYRTGECIAYPLFLKKRTATKITITIITTSTRSLIFAAS
jgi:hypothetical protein